MNNSSSPKGGGRKTTKLSELEQSDMDLLEMTNEIQDLNAEINDLKSVLDASDDIDEQLAIRHQIISIYKNITAVRNERITIRQEKTSIINANMMSMQGPPLMFPLDMPPPPGVLPYGNRPPPSQFSGGGHHQQYDRDSRDKTAGGTVAGRGANRRYKSSSSTVRDVRVTDAAAEASYSNNNTSSASATENSSAGSSNNQGGGTFNSRRRRPNSAGDSLSSSSSSANAAAVVVPSDGSTVHLQATYPNPHYPPKQRRQEG